MDFVERKIINGALMRQHIGKHVSIFLNVEMKAERSSSSFTGRTTDDVTVKVLLDEPLNVTLSGWIEVIGIPKSSDSIQNTEIILFQEEDGAQIFDKNAHNSLVTLMHNTQDELFA